MATPQRDETQVCIQYRIKILEGAVKNFLEMDGNDLVTQYYFMGCQINSKKRPNVNRKLFVHSILKKKKCKRRPSRDKSTLLSSVSSTICRRSLVGMAIDRNVAIPIPLLTLPIDHGASANN